MSVCKKQICKRHACLYGPRSEQPTKKLHCVETEQWSLLDGYLDNRQKFIFAKGRGLIVDVFLLIQGVSDADT